MMDRRQADEHINEMHVNRQLQDDLDRMLREHIFAASSFVSEEVKDALKNETMRRGEREIRAWLDQPRPDLRFVLQTEFEPDDAERLGVPVTSVGFAKDTERERIWLCQTNAVSVVLQLNDYKSPEKGYFVYNAYPYVQNPTEEQRLDVDVFPYAQITRTWQNADPMQRTHIRILCDHVEHYDVTFNEKMNALSTTVREGDAILGTVEVQPDYVTWRLQNERRPVVCKYPHMETVMRRAFPETYATIDYMRSLYRATLHDMDLERDTPQILDVIPYDIRRAICTMPKRDESPTDMEHTDGEGRETSQDALDRRRKRALSRSKKATAVRKDKKRKRSSSKRQKTKTRRTESAKTVPTHVSIAKRNEKSRHVDDDMAAYHWLCVALERGSILACRETQQAIMITSMLPEETSSNLIIARMPTQMIDDVREDMSRTYPDEITSRDIDCLRFTDYNDTFEPIRSNGAYTRMPTSTWHRMLKAISHDPHWQPLVPEGMLLWMMENVRIETSPTKLEVMRRTLDVTAEPVDILEITKRDVPTWHYTEEDAKRVHVEMTTPSQVIDDTIVDTLSILSKRYAKKRQEPTSTELRVTTRSLFGAKRTIRNL